MRPRIRDVKVWRYLSFGRFVWMLKEKALWMARADRLGDQWEMSPTEEEIEAFSDRRKSETAPEMWPGFRDLVIFRHDSWRRRTFVNCWSASDYESHAMWTVYGGSTEAVAVQTTLRKLKRAVLPIHVIPVDYRVFRPRGHDLAPIDLVSRKRKPFAYEKEYRVVSIDLPEPSSRGRGLLEDLERAPTPEDFGFPLKWDPETSVDRVLLHPAADPPTVVAVKAVVAAFAPKLQSRVVTSAMAEQPPA